MYCLGMYYRQALIGIEANFDTFPIFELQRLGYPNQYIREKEDTYTGKKEPKYGFKTTLVTRPLIISNLAQVVIDMVDLINDKETLEEMLTFIRNEKGRAEAQVGYHDDLVMALAIAYYIKDQVIFNKTVVKSEYKFNFDIEKPRLEDWGDEIVVV